jgi:murein DD-endopeptidase MepM/ murein hydrolase activator NlpD
MSVFPLDRRPTMTWHESPANTHFGAPRGGGFPVHGACDLVTPAGTGVLAVQNGRIVGKYPFVTYCQGTEHQTTTWAIDVAHERCMMRYGEISADLPDGLDVGSEVTEGQLIAFVGVQCNGTMLHLEMFDDPGRIGNLTDTSNTEYLYVPRANYQRRNDLLNPTYLLDRWISEVREFRRGGNVVW